MTDAFRETSHSEDPRIRHLVGTAPEPRVAILGFPVDEGVRLNGGRPGAAGAPAKITETLMGMTPDVRNQASFEQLLETLVDAGSVVPEASLARSQDSLATRVEGLVRRSIMPIVLGGGHETAWGHFQGLVRAGRKPYVVNVDAHADVRPLRDGQGHSGSPFRQIMERDECRGYSVLGLQGFSNASAHIDYLRGKGGDFFWAESVTPSLMQSTLADAGEPIMVSFDMDAVDQSAAPGVSAPCPSGLSPALWLDLAFRAGASSHVTSFELVEVNPRFDVDGATVRLAAATVWNFLRGVAAR